MNDADPVLVEILRNRVSSLMDQALETMVRTARSPIISELADCSVDLWDADRQLLGMASAIPVHLQSLQSVLDRVLEEIPPEELTPGDVLLTNDPYRGAGQHLPDIAMIQPVFFGGEIVGYVGSMAHHQDIGGKTPGGYPEHADEVFEEGYRIPPMHIVEGGDLDEKVVAFLVTNSRTDDEDMRGDLRAQIASCQYARDGYVELLEKYGRDRVKTQEREWLDTTEQRARDVIEGFPDGQYTFTDTVEAPAADHTIRVAIDIDGSDVHVDYAGSDSEVEGAPLNSMFAATRAMSTYAICTLLPTDLPKNGGTFRPIDVSAPEGSLVNPVEPRACSNRNLLCHRLPDVVYGALVDAVPDRVMAACYGSTCGIAFYFRDDEGFKSVGGVNPGGWGATSAGDGESVLCAHVSNTYSFEMEAAERDGPILVDRYAFRQDSGGPGEFRGGLGLDYRIQYLGEEGEAVLRGGRHRHPPFGLRGGQPGARGRYRYRPADADDWDVLGANEDVTVGPGDEIWYQSAGGGGYGDPNDRDPEIVIADVRAGLVSPDAAREAYGVDPGHPDQE